MTRAVRFERYGGIEVLQVVDAPRPAPGPGRVVVEVRAAGINPGEARIRTGLSHDRFPATFPSGQGSDLAGVVVEVADDGTAGPFALGDEVLGWSNERSSHAELVAVPVTQLVAKPPGLSWEQAGALPIAGTTAWAGVEVLLLQPGETVVVAGAAGGVGGLAAQLARRQGAAVIGLASEGHHDWLTSRGVRPMPYGAGLAERLRDAAPDAFFDAYGEGYVALAVQLGIPPGRINTIIDRAAAADYGTHMAGSAAGARVEVLAELAGLVAAGELDLPVAAAYPLDRVQDAYREVEQRHTLGKIVLIP